MASQLINDTPVPLRPKNINTPSRSHRQQLTKSALISTPPAGHQFVTTFDCKYYGSSTVASFPGKPSSVRCSELVRTAVDRNSRQHMKTLLRITDRGIRISDKMHTEALFDLGVDQLVRIIPGNLISKSGKKFSVALIFEKAEGVTDEVVYHVIQFRHKEDAGYMHEASKRMWKDHMFTALLDVSTEDGQMEFDSFTIEMDIATAAKRCSHLIHRELQDVDFKMDDLLSA